MITRISDLSSHVGETVTLAGWLYNKRSSKKVHFLEIRDGSGIVQAVLGQSDVDEKTFQEADKLTQETSIRVTGIVKKHPKLENVYELGATGLEVVNATSAEYPITPKEHGTDFLMDHRHLWLRSKRQHAILRIRHTIVQAIRDYFDELDFTLVDAPVFTPNACEGTSNLFETDYHGDKAYLTQSGQLYMEAGAAAFGKVYCFGPTFRAEKSKTRRHLAEFWMVEPEVAYMDLAGDMELAEGLICKIVARVLEKRRPELAILERDIAKLEAIKAPFPRITYEAAIGILNKHGNPAKFGDDIGGDEETIIANEFGLPVIVHRYPKEIKAFYMKQDPDDARCALGMDILAPEGYGEIVGGGQREESYDVLIEKIKEHGLPQEAFEWYLDLRRYGSFPHAGFGLGVERSVAWICGLPHVRETIPFPRMLNRLSPLARSPLAPGPVTNRLGPSVMQRTSEAQAQAANVSSVDDRGAPRDSVGGASRAAIMTAIFFGAPPILEIGHATGGSERTRAWFASVAGAMARTFQLEVHVEGELPTQAREVRVANHTSYLDILLLAGLRGGRFLAMKDVADWFMVGRVAKRIGCIFLDRASKKDRAAVVRILTDAARSEPTPIIVFPEGGTCMGASLRPFQAGAFVVARRANVPIRPIAIVYDDLDEVGWVDDMPLGKHVWRRLSGPVVRARVVSLPLVTPAEGETAEQLATRVRTMIEAVARPR